MKDVKIRTYGIKELSEKIQARLFELGAVWAGGRSKVWHTDWPYLCVKNNILYYDDNVADFEKHTIPEVTYQDLLDMQPDKKTRQEKFYLWAFISRLGQLTCTNYLYSDTGQGYEDGNCHDDGDITKDIQSGKAWKLNPDNPVILEVEL
jgi:hypothetical protein